MRYAHMFTSMNCSDNILYNNRWTTNADIQIRFNEFEKNFFGD